MAPDESPNPTNPADLGHGPGPAYAPPPPARDYDPAADPLSNPGVSGTGSEGEDVADPVHVVQSTTDLETVAAELGHPADQLWQLNGAALDHEARAHGISDSMMGRYVPAGFRLLLPKT